MRETAWIAYFRTASFVRPVKHGKLNEITGIWLDEGIYGAGGFDRYMC